MRLFAALFLLVPSLAFGQALFQAEAEGVRIVLHKDACTMSSQVSNLPYRATWDEKGKTFEGCYGLNPQIGVVVAFFSDKTAVAIPMQMFVRVTGA